MKTLGVDGSCGHAAAIDSYAADEAISPNALLWSSFNVSKAILSYF